MNLKALSDHQLLINTKGAIDIETTAVTNVVRHFVEIYRRDLFLKRGFSSMFALATKEFGYDKASAQRRVNAMELALAQPDILEKIDRRELCLQSVADIQTFLNKERGSKRRYSPEQIADLVEACSNLSTREVQIELSSRNPSLDLIETKTFVSKDRIRISHTISVTLEEKFERIKQLRSHVNPYASREDILEFVLDFALERIDPVRKARRAQEKPQRRKIPIDPVRKAHPADGEPQYEKDSSELIDEPRGQSEMTMSQSQPTISPVQLREEVVPETGEIQLAADFDSLDETGDDAVEVPAQETLAQTRHISATENHKFWLRTHEDGCLFTDLATGKRCGSKFQTQRDHVLEYSRGGSNEEWNLQNHCAKHNRLRWRQRSQSRVRADYRAYG